LGKRQACGGAAGSCPAGQCCSQSSGRCGTGPTFCNGPDCQLAFGPACDGNIVPPGPSTANIARPRVGNVPYGGAGVLHCTTQGTVALTFDDGPFTFTQSVLDTLASYNAKATFFINGNNLGKGRIDDPSKPWAQILKNMYNAGHQIASHTWTHQDLTLTAGTLRENQVIYNEMAFRNIFGFCPTYIRPPYGFCNAGCSDYLNSMGYHIVYFDIDTKDYQNDDPSKIQISKDYFSGNVSSTVAGHSYISLSHDVHQQTAASLVTYMLDTLKARGYRTATVGECMGDPKENWYRDAGGVPSASAAPVASQAPTTSSKTSTSTTITSTSSSSTSSSSSSTSKLT
ncbi:polysaccharide deacetylase, partial [Halenospora varia]